MEEEEEEEDASDLDGEDKVEWGRESAERREGESRRVTEGSRKRPFAKGSGRGSGGGSGDVGRRDEDETGDGKDKTHSMPLLTPATKVLRRVLTQY